MRTRWKKWRLAPDSDPEQGLIVTTEDGENEVCGVVYDEADANLIAAAPELCDALCYLLQETVDMGLHYGVELSDGERDSRTQALEAIAKTQGFGRDVSQDQPVDPEVAWWKANANRVISVAAALAGGLMARPGFVETLKPKSVVDQAAAIVREVTDRAADPYSGE